MKRALFTILFLFAGWVQGATITLYKGDAIDNFIANNNQYYLQIKGAIVVGDLARLKRELAKLKGNYALSVFLDSPGGIVYEAMEMGRVLRTYNPTMHVGNFNPATNKATKAGCYSACTHLFASGRWRFMPKDGSELGVHQFSSRGRGDESVAQYLVAVELAYFKDMGVDSAELNTIAKMVMHSQIHVLTPATLRRTSLVNDGREAAVWQINTVNNQFYVIGSQNVWSGENKISLLCDQSGIRIALFAEVGARRVAQIKAEKWQIYIFIDDAHVALKTAQIGNVTNPEVFAASTALDSTTLTQLSNIKRRTGIALIPSEGSPTFVGGFIDADEKQRDLLKSFIGACKGKAAP